MFSVHPGNQRTSTHGFAAKLHGQVSDILTTTDALGSLQAEALLSAPPKPSWMDPSLHLTSKQRLVVQSRARGRGAGKSGEPEGHDSGI